MKKVYLHSFPTPIGIIRTAATERGLAVVALPGESEAEFERRVQRMFLSSDIASGGKINRAAEKQIRSYLEGKLRKFKIRFDLHAPPFSRKALQAVAAIPYGMTMTYGEIARAVGNPKAARAVGNANARNPLPLVIPCHRVVATNGLGGYSAGLDIKRWLLRLEGVL